MQVLIFIHILKKKKLTKGYKTSKWQNQSLHNGLWLRRKEFPCNAEHSGLIPGSRRSPGEGNSIFLPWKSHGQGSLAGYSPQVTKSQYTTEQVNHHHNQASRTYCATPCCFSSPPPPNRDGSKNLRGKMLQGLQHFSLNHI